MNSSPGSEKEFALALYYHIAEMIKAGRTHAEIEAALVKQGMPLATAQQMLARLEASRAKVTRRNGRRNILIGAGIALLGLLLSSGVLGPTSSTAAHLFAWGLVLGGSIWLLRGLIQSLIV